MKLNKNIKIFLNYFLGPVLFIWLSFSIYTQIKNQPNLELSWIKVRKSINSPSGWNLLITCMLMVVNWAIEAWKWKIAIHRIQPVPFLKAFKAILTGVSFSVSTPNRIGEYLGRVLYMEEGKRMRAISITIVCSISQLILTLFMGCFGLMILMRRMQQGEIASSLWITVVIFGVIISLLIILLFYFRLSWFVRLLNRLPGSSRYAYFINAVEEINSALLIRLLLLSALRFFVFIIQYYLLFTLFGVGINWWQSVWVVSISFLVLMIIPTIALLELGLRGEVSLKIFGLFSANSLGIGLTTLTVWLVNLVIPSIIGSLLILNLRIFKKTTVKSE